MAVPPELKAAADEVAQGKPRQTTPRALISWFGAQRRGYHVAKRVREALIATGVTTSPDFEFSWIDGDISIEKATTAPVTSAGTGQANGTSQVTAVGQSQVAEPPPTPASDPTYRIGKLEAANRVPTVVAADDPVGKAVTLMMVNDFSQLPIMQGDRAVKGLISWESIAQTMHLGKPCAKVADCATAAHETSADTSLFDAIAGINRHGYAMIRARDQRITGIVTATDLGVQLGKLGEPFLLLGELENYLRRVIDTRFTVAQLRLAKDPADQRVVDGVEDLTFGEYIRLLENPTNWDQLRLSFERAEFVKGLQAIREIRNNVMHFDPDGPSDEDLGTLRRWVSLFQRLAALKVL